MSTTDLLHIGQAIVLAALFILIAQMIWMNVRREARDQIEHATRMRSYREMVAPHRLDLPGHRPTRLN
jgi:hypothetical protein